MVADPDKAKRLQLMKFVCSFAWADLEVRPEEREFIARLARRLALSDDEAREVEGWLKLPPSPESVDPTQIPTAHRRLFLREIQGVIESDGDIAIEERENFELLKTLLG